MRIFVGFVILLSGFSAHSAERKPMTEVDLATLTNETQKNRNLANGIDLVWWIPVEFWEASLRSTSEMTEEQILEFVTVLKPYSLVAVVQADISPFGAFKFAGREEVSGGLTIQYTDQQGTGISIPLNEVSDPDLDILLRTLTPLLSAAMGEMGSNFFFFPLSDERKNGDRLISPYESGSLLVTLSSREEFAPTEFEFEFPLDSLFVPRICRNGKPAHVSWKYCPWSGKKLKN